MDVPLSSKIPYFFNPSLLRMLSARGSIDPSKYNIVHEKNLYSIAIHHYKEFAKPFMDMNMIASVAVYKAVGCDKGKPFQKQI